MPLGIQKGYLYHQDILMTHEILLISAQFWELKSRCL